MAAQQIVISRDINKSVEQVFDAIADHSRLGEIAGLPVRRVRDGGDEINGLGSARVVYVGPMPVEETIVGFQRHRSIEYRITRNAGPLANHHGRIEFKSLGSLGCRVTWSIRFDSWPVIGALIAGLLRLGIGRMLRRL
jgi:hypothetical protein